MYLHFYCAFRQYLESVSYFLAPLENITADVAHVISRPVLDGPIAYPAISNQMVTLYPIVLTLHGKPWSSVVLDQKDVNAAREYWSNFRPHRTGINATMTR